MSSTYKNHKNYLHTIIRSLAEIPTGSPFCIDTSEHNSISSGKPKLGFNLSYVQANLYPNLLKVGNEATVKCEPMDGCFLNECFGL